MNMSKKELQEILSKNPAIKVKQVDLDSIPDEKQSKYNAIPTMVDGHRFPSQAEAKRYGELLVLKMAGVVKEFWLQPKYELQAGLTYKPDFKITYSDGHIEVEEVKGKWTPDARMRVKLFRDKYPDIPLKIIRNGVVEE